MQCEATSKRSGARCRRHAVTNHRVCPMHGGTVRRGPDSPKWRHGLWSKHIPANVGRIVSDLLAEGGATDLRQETALLEALLLTVLGRSAEAGRQQLTDVEIDAVPKLIDAKRRVLEVHWKLEVANKRVITAQQFQHVIQSLSEAVRRCVHDPAVLRSLQAELTRLLIAGQQVIGADANAATAEDRPEQA